MCSTTPYTNCDSTSTFPCEKIIFQYAQNVQASSNIHVTIFTQKNAIHLSHISPISLLHLSYFSPTPLFTIHPPFPHTSTLFLPHHSPHSSPTILPTSPLPSCGISGIMVVVMAISAPPMQHSWKLWSHCGEKRLARSHDIPRSLATSPR